jgi:threonine dehydratase
VAGRLRGLAEVKEREGPTLEHIRAAAERIRGAVAQTACPESLAFAGLTDGRVHLKLESMQRTGSFKERGALNRLLHLDAEERARGVITMSAGNHAQALAYHARRLGVAATVVMPVTTPLVKVSRTRALGATVVQHGATLDDAAGEVRRRIESEGPTLVHPFDDEHVIAGQGTIGLELAEQLPGLSTVVVPIGGGGLVSGIAIALKSLRPDVRVVGVEPEAAATAFAARAAGERVLLPSVETMADGVAVKRVGARTFPLIERWVDDLVTVSEDEIASAIVLLLEQERIVVEGAGAVGVAALATGKVEMRPGEVVAAVISGGNIDLNLVSRIIERGLSADGRVVRLRVRVRDRPGALAKLTQTVAAAEGNVLEVYHRRGFADISVPDVEIVLHVETRGREHAAEIVGALEALGHRVESSF